MLHALLGISNWRLVCAVSSGPPNAPVAFRVSATRHGVTGMNCKPDDVVAADDELVLRAATIFSARSARVEDVLTIALRKAEWGGSWGKSGQTISGSSLLRDTKRVRGDDQTRRNETSNKY